MWVSLEYLNNKVGSGQTTALNLHSGTVLAQYELEARATVASVLQYAGYEVPTALDSGSITTGFLQKMTSALILKEAYANGPGILMSPQVQDAISDGLGLIDAVHAKKIPIPGLSPSAQNALGGVRFDTASRPRKFNLRGTSF
jgi:hypothetical protein